MLVLCMYAPWQLFVILGLIVFDIVVGIIDIIASKRIQDEKKLEKYVKLTEVAILINLTVIIVIIGINLVDQLRLNPCECGCEP